MTMAPLQGLQVRDLRVTSPSTWQRSQPQGQVSFRILAPAAGERLPESMPPAAVHPRGGQIAVCAPYYCGLPTRMSSPRAMIWRVPLVWFIPVQFR